MYRDKRVFIVKNNDYNSDIYINARESFKRGNEEMYFVRNANRQHLSEEAEVGDRGLFLLLTYSKEGSGEIKTL